MCSAVAVNSLVLLVAPEASTLILAVECALRIIGGQEIPRVVWTPQALIDSTNVDMPAAEIIKWADTAYTD